MFHAQNRRSEHTAASHGCVTIGVMSGDRYFYRQRVQRQGIRPAPAPCLHCRYRPARLYAKNPKMATGFCSDSCRTNHQSQRQQERARILAEAIRNHLGLPAGRGCVFTVPELEAIERRLVRVLPYGGLAMKPARLPQPKRKRTGAAQQIGSGDAQGSSATVTTPLQLSEVYG